MISLKRNLTLLCGWLTLLPTPGFSAGQSHDPSPWSHPELALSLLALAACIGFSLKIRRDLLGLRRLRDREMRERDSILQAMVNASPEAFFLMAHDGTVLAANSGLHRRLNVTDGSLLGTNIYEYLPADLASARRQQVEKVVATGLPLVFDDQRDGRSITHHLFPLPDEQGGPAKIAVFALDATARIQSEEALRQTASQLRLHSMVLDQIQDAVTITDLQGVITYVNQAQARLFSRTCQDLIGHSVETFGHDPTKGATQQEIIDQTLTNGHWQGDVVNFDADGRPFTMHCRTTLIRDEEGTPVGMCGVATNITDRKALEDELRKSRSILSTSQELSRTGGWEWDPAKKEMYWTDQTFAIHDIADNDRHQGDRMLIEQSIACYHPDDRPKILEAFEQCCESGRPYDLEFPLTTVSGRPVWIRTAAKAVMENGRVSKVVGNIMDITERKRTEMLLQARLRLSLLSSSLEMDQLLQNVLDEAERLTGSSIGFFLFLTPDQQSIQLKTWSANTMKSMCSVDVQSEHYPVELAGVWADAVRERRPIIHNDYPNLPGRRGLPPGHAPVWREMVVPIFRRERIVAVFGVGNKTGDYDQADVDSLSILGDMAWDLVRRKQAEDGLRTSLEEKNALLREVHHRVKNNLAAIIGLLDLQRDAMRSDEAHEVLIELSSRIRAMSLIHEKLYRSESLSEVDFQSYIQSLVSHLRTSFGSPLVVFDVQAQEATLPLDLAVPCGMIINELVTNALKHAFRPVTGEISTASPRIRIALSRETDAFVLTVADNGRGLPLDLDWRQTKTLGLTLVRMLGEHQLGGAYSVDADRGASFTLSFPDPARRTA
jgi:PAS domain S-box-containing protein